MKTKKQASEENDDIFYKTLEIGYQNHENGVTLIELKEKLQIDNKIVDTYFLNCFTNISNKNKSFGTLKNWGDSNNLNIDFANKNKHTLKAEYINEFLNLKHNKKQFQLLQDQYDSANESATESKKESNRAINYAIIAIIISALMGIPDFINLIYYSNNTEITAKIQETIDTLKAQNAMLRESNQHLDFLHLKVKDVAKMETQDSINLEDINKSLKKILKKIESYENSN